MRQVVFASMLMIAAISTSAAQAPSYNAQLVITAQEALVRLGYDPGPIDGQWGRKARAAMNELRQAHGLLPAEDFAGSSLALVHSLSPGETTLPHPGILIADPVARRAFIGELPDADPARNLCPGPSAFDDEQISDVIAEDPIAIVSTTSTQKLGYITRSDDWFTPIMHAVSSAHNLCIAGDDTSCIAIVELMSKWSDADAIGPGASRSERAFEDISWIANILLRKFVFAYADARILTDVAPQKDASILDWMKGRIDEYHYIRPSGKPLDSIDYTEAGNHSLADMMPAMAFGAMVGDRSMMEGAFESYRVALGSMRDDGSLPVETRRGARSLHYTNFQLGQLLATEEVARAQDIDLTVDDAASGQTIPKAVGFLIDAYEDFDKVTPYAKANHGAGPSDDYTIPFILPSHLGWLPAYHARFGSDVNIQRITKFTFRFDERACSAAAMEEGKLRPEQVCDTGHPNVRQLLSKWETADSESMGYSAFCLQGLKAAWPPW